MKKALATMLFALLAFPAVLFGHEHWITVDDFSPQQGASGRFYICSGHDFPRSQHLLGDRILHRARLVPPRGSDIPLSSLAAADGKLRTGDVRYGTQGVHLLCFELKKPQVDSPLFWAKAIVIVGETDDVSAYTAGKGLEVVPLAALSAARAGGEIPLAVFRDGKRVAATLNIIPEHGKSSILRTSEERPAQLKLKRAGRYLITCSHAGKACSLLISISAEESEK